MSTSTPHRSDTPRVDRPEIPDAYGIGQASEHVEWNHVEERLTKDRVYWIATTDITRDPTRFRFGS